MKILVWVTLKKKKKIERSAGRKKGLLQGINYLEAACLGERDFYRE